MAVWLRLRLCRHPKKSEFVNKLLIHVAVRAQAPVRCRLRAWFRPVLHGATSLHPPELLACGEDRPARSLRPPGNNRRTTGMESGIQMGHASPSMSKAAPAGRVSAMAFGASHDAVQSPFSFLHRHESIETQACSCEPRSNLYFPCHPPVTENRCRKA